jgi:hypothetical protein
MTYKRKNILLVFIFLALFIYAFTGPIRKTISLNRDNFSLIGTVESMDDNLDKIDKLNLQLAGFDSLLVHSGNGLLQVNLLEEIGHLSQDNAVIVKSLEYPEQNTKGFFEIETFTIKLEGSFKSLLKVIFSLERRTEIGRIISVDFKVSKNESVNRRKLYCTLYIQRYKPKTK